MASSEITQTPAHLPPTVPVQHSLNGAGYPTEKNREDLVQKSREQQVAFERSEKVRLQLRSVAEQLQNKVSDLEAQLTPQKSDLELEIAALEEQIEGFEKREEEQKQRRAQVEAETKQNSEQVDALRKLVASAEAQVMQAKEEAASKDAEWAEKHSAMESKLGGPPGSIDAELLQKTEAENARLKNELTSTDEECKRLRAALAENWAHTADTVSVINEFGLPSVEVNSSEAEPVRQSTTQADRGHSASVPEASASEQCQRIQHLERVNGTLEAKLKVLVERNAYLQSGALDLQDEGKTMREVLMHKNEQFLKRLDELTDERKAVKADREKLLTECVDLQGDLENLRTREKELLPFEGLHRRLEAERQALSAEVERLRATNTALCAQVFGEEQNDAEERMTRGSEDGVVAEDANVEQLQMVLKLHKRLTNRKDTHWAEREKLLERIQELERATMQHSMTSLDARADGGKASQKKAEPSSSSASGRSWVTNLGGGIMRPPVKEEPQGIDKVAAQLRGSLNSMKDWLP